METLDKRLYIYPQGGFTDIILPGPEMGVFQEAKKSAQGRMEAIKKVRELIPNFFPEVKDLKPAQRTDVPNIVGGRQRSLTDRPLSNDFLIARSLVDLLWEEK